MGWDESAPTTQELTTAGGWDSHPPTDAELSQATPSIGQRVVGGLGTALKALNSVTIAPVLAAQNAAVQGANAFAAAKNQFANMKDEAPSGSEIMQRLGVSNKSSGPIYGGKFGEYASKNGMNPDMPSKAKILGSIDEMVSNPLNLIGPVSKFMKGGAEGVSSLVDAGEVGTKESADAIQSASKRLGFEATPGMTSNSETVQGLESSLAQSPSLAGAVVRKSLKPIQGKLQSAAEDIISGAAETSPYATGDSISKGILANLGEQANNVKMSYEPFNQELPKMVPDMESKWKLADSLNDIAQDHLDPNEVSGKVTAITNKVMNSKNLADIEDTRKLIGNDITKALAPSNPDRNLANTLIKIKDNLSDFRDSQFQTLAKDAYPGPNGEAIGKQMVDQYQNTMAGHAALMNRLRGVAPLFDITANNPRDFFEQFSEIKPEKLAKTLFDSGDYDATLAFKEAFPEQYEALKGMKINELRKASLSNPIDPVNSPIDPRKLIGNINKMEAKAPEATSLLLGDKVQKINDMRTVFGATPKYIGPSGTPEGEAFRHMAEPMQQIRDVGNYAAYKALGSKNAPGIMGKLTNAASSIPKSIPSIPNSAGPISSIMMNTANAQNKNIPGYSDGGTVTTSVPLPNINPQKAQSAQESMRKAFGFAAGGVVPGTPQFPMNTPQNDNTLIKATPGEVVLPLSVTQSSNPPQMAKEFMANQTMNNVQQGPQKGPEKWAADGMQNMKMHVGDSDKEWLVANKGKLMLDPKTQNLLITASSFEPGSKPLDDIMKHLKNRLDKK